MTANERNKMVVAVSYLETDLLPIYGENTSLGTIIRSMKSKIKNYEEKQKKQ